MKKNLFDFPAYPDGAEHGEIYSCGHGLTMENPRTLMRVIDNADFSGYLKYISELTEKGFILESQNTIDCNSFHCFKREGGGLLYSYYIEHLKQIKLIDDPVSMLPSEFSVDKIEGNYPCRLIMFPITDKDSGGDFYMISLPDGSFIAIDGNFESDNALVADEFFKIIKSLSPEGKIRIACWFITHGHRDHFTTFQVMLERHSEEISLERVMFNVVDGDIKKDENYPEFVNCQNTIVKLYPGVKYLKIHTGMTVKFGTVKFDFLYTQEDNILCYLSEKNAYHYTHFDYNMSCAVAKIAIGDINVLALADLFRSDYYLGRMYALETCCADIVKIAHHYFNINSNKFYEDLFDTAKTKFWLVNAGEKRITEAGKAKNMQELCGDKMIYSTDFVYLFEIIDGNIIKTEIPFKNYMPQSGGTEV